MKKLLYLVLTLIALLLLYLRFSYAGNSQKIPSTNPSTSPVSSVTPQPKMQVNLTEKLDNAYFTLSYDKEATTSTSRSPDSQEWVISYMGEEQKKSGRTQTELWDGYMLSITRFETIGEDPDQKQAEVDRRGIIDGCGEDKSTPIKAGKLGEYDTLTFYGGCLGEGDYYYLMIADTLYRITVMVVGSQGYTPDYRVTVDAIFDTLKFK